MSEFSPLEQQIMDHVRTAENAVVEASRLVGAAMGSLALVHGDETAAAILYALADATATRGKPARPADEHLPPHLR